MEYRVLLLIVAALVVNDRAIAGEGGPPVRTMPTKALWGAQLSEARAARSRADLMRADLEKRMPAATGAATAKQGASPAPGKFDAEAAAVVRAYQEVIERYPHTEIAAECALRLSGFYQYQGRYDEAAELSAKTASEFAGTPGGLKAVFNTGLIHAQARGDYAEASKWFLRIPKPDKPPGAAYDQEDKLYLAAQQQLAKCELRLGQDGQAEKRSGELKQAFPQFGDQLDKSFRFEVASRDSAANAKSLLTLSVETKAKLLIGVGLTLILVGLSLFPRFSNSQASK